MIRSDILKSFVIRMPATISCEAAETAATQQFAKARHVIVTDVATDANGKKTLAA